MPRHLSAALVILIFAGPASAVIKVLTPLKQVLDAEQLILTAEVASVDPDKPAVVFTFKENLKGKCPFESLAVNLTGDSYAKKDNHAQVMLDRLIEGRKLILFASKQGKNYSAFGFIEGTWFQLKGTPDADGKTVRWAFLHCEPYFRRTFKGTTAELQESVTKYLTGKGDPPAPDEKEPAGYGPKAEKKKKCDSESPGCGFANPVRVADSTIRAPHSTLFAVIPSFVLVGPLAVLAALFPGVFARLAIGMKRWRAFLVIASLTSTLALLYFWLRGNLPDSRWVGSQAFALLLIAISVAGLLWAGWRYRDMAARDPAVTAAPAMRELYILIGLNLFTAGAIIVLGWIYGAGSLIEWPWREFTAIGAGLAAATVYTIYRIVNRGDVDSAANTEPKTRLSLSSESVGLAAIVLFGTILLVGTWPREKSTFVDAGEIGSTNSTTIGPRLADVRLLFTSTDAEQVMSGVTIAQDGRAFFGTLKKPSLLASGEVWCVGPDGKVIWKFDDDGGLMPVFATPTVEGNRVFVGEGLHMDSDRRLFALDAATGKPVWNVPTTSHTEGTPRVVDGKVYFCAGDDGVYCVKVSDGMVLWHLQGTKQKRLHIDTPPAVADGRVFFGSGYHTRALLCADAATGNELWRTPVELRSFGPPLVRREHVFFGLGTGNLVDDLSTEAEPGVAPETKPAGAVVCVDVKTGAIIWRYDLPKSVHAPLAADTQAIYACSKDGWVHAINRGDGTLRWKRQVGESFAAGPTLATYANGAATLGVYVVTREGRALCLHPADGKVFWSRELSETTKKAVEVFSTPTVIAEPSGVRRQVYFGVKLTNTGNEAKTAAVIRIEDVVED